MWTSIRHVRQASFVRPPPNATTSSIAIGVHAATYSYDCWSHRMRTVEASRAHRSVRMRYRRPKTLLASCSNRWTKPNSIHTSRPCSPRGDNCYRTTLSNWHHRPLILNAVRMRQSSRARHPTKLANVMYDPASIVWNINVRPCRMIWTRAIWSIAIRWIARLGLLTVPAFMDRRRKTFNRCAHT